MSKPKLCEGWRKSIKAKVTAWGGSHVGKRDCDAVLLFDSEEYSNIPNISLTEENVMQLIPQLFDSTCQTVMNDLMFRGLEITKFEIGMNTADIPSLVMEFYNKTQPDKRPIRYIIDLTLPQLLNLHKMVNSAIKKHIDRYSKKISTVMDIHTNNFVAKL